MGGLHHAGISSGEGFCIFNDVAVAAQYLADQEKKVCVYDTDAHHGNGTMEIFYDDSDVLFISLHQDPRTLYPGEGRVIEFGENGGKGYTVNLPLPRGAQKEDYKYGIEEVVKPIVRQFSPDVVIRNGGSDPHHSDSLTDLKLDMEGLKHLGGSAREMADESSAGHIDLVVSGYGNRVVEGWHAIFLGSLGIDADVPDDKKIGDFENDPKAETKDMVKDLKDVQSKFWDV